MEIYDSRYFRINKKLMVLGGLWPYEENIVKKVFYRFYLGVTIIALSIPQVHIFVTKWRFVSKKKINVDFEYQFYGVYKNFGTRADKIIEHTTILMFVCGVFLKLITAIMAENNVKQITY